MNIKNSMYKIIISFIIHITLLCYVSTCPQGCICIDQDNAVPATYCDGLMLHKTPGKFNANIEILSLRGNNLYRLNRNDFYGLHNLRKLNLVQNSITEISENAFRHLTSLKILNLGNNRLRVFPVEAFRHLTSLEELYLNNNEFDKLPTDIINVLPKLQRLHLQSNKIVLDETNKIFTQSNNLVYLDLSHNKFSSINNRMFQHTKKIKWLYLNHNFITTIEKDSFDELEDLTEVCLHNNMLTSVSEDFLSNKLKLSRISVHNNPLSCDCRLLWLNKVIKKGWPLIQSTSNLKCNTPFKYRGILISKLRPEQFGCFGEWDSWTPWSSCTKTCNGGVRYRRRYCSTNARTSVKGYCKGDNTQSEQCNTFSCTMGVITQWTEWSHCSATCYGVTTRSRKCIDPFTGSKTETCLESNYVESKKCNHIRCPVNGGWSKWTQWSACDKKCGLGMTTRERHCNNPTPKFGGSICVGGHKQVEKKICFEARCDPKTHWSSWSEYSQCSVTCGHGIKIRKRSCLNEYNQKIDIVNICPGSSTQTDACKAHIKTCKHEGAWSTWSVWSRCSKLSCQRYRTRICNNPYPTDGESKCKGEWRESESCSKEECIVNTVWGQWGEWSGCSKKCDGGIKTRQRKCLGQQYSHITCGFERVESQPCNIQKCPHSQWAKWSDWSECTNKLYGKQVRRRACLSFGGKRCPGREKERRSCSSKNWQQGGGIAISQSIACIGREKIPNGYETIKKTSDGIKATYHCNKYFKLKGPKHLTCIHGKGWSSRAAPYCVPVCGKPVRQFSSHWLNRARLFGGAVASPKSWPWQVAIEVKTQLEGWKLRCGGSLINDQWIVTAAHCLHDKHAHEMYKPREVKVFLGVHNVSQRYKKSEIQNIEASFVQSHPLFHQPTLDHDIGLIELRTKAKLTDSVLPVCLPSSRQRSLSKRGKIGTVVGWGATRKGIGSELLKELRLPVVSRRECVNAYLGKYNVTNAMFCAGKKKGFDDTCKGDSGGGYLFKDRRKNKWILQGVVSWGGDSCGEAGQYSVYTRVSNFTRWIRKVMRKRYQDRRKYS